jgi:hypothetical protein
MGLIGPEWGEPASSWPAPEPGNLATTGVSGSTSPHRLRNPLSLHRLAARWTGVLALLAALGGAPLAGQTCPEGAIARVLVVNHSIFDPEDLATATRFRWAYGLANALHVRTREGFIRSELLFREGGCYDPRLLAESERLLRNYRFIARAEITAQPQSDGGWIVLVATRDEWTTRVSVQGTMSDGPQVERIGVTEQNLLGLGILVGGSVRSLNDGEDLAARVELPRLLGTRTDASLRWARVDDGGHLIQSLSYPFLGEVGRLAASQSYRRRKGWFEYSAAARSDDQSGGISNVYLPIDEELLEITVAGRLGRPGNLTILGMGFSNQTLEFPAFEDRLEVGFGDEGDHGPADSATAEVVRPQTVHSAGTHVNLMLAQRNVRFQEFRGLDALRGTQDVPLGAQVSLLLGRRIGTLSASARQPDDLLGSLRAEWAGAGGPLLVVTAGGVEGRRIFAGAPAGERWKDVLAELTALVYWQPPALPRHTFFLRASGVGGWSLTQPFQLTLGGGAGVRGYSGDDFPGGRRIVLDAEDRIYVGWPHPELFDLGVTLLADVGRMWPGDAPFGVDSGWRGTVGAGLRVGFPAGSGRVGRLDVAWPVSGAGIERVPQLRVSIGDPVGLSAGTHDRQLARTRVDLGPDRFTEHLR